MGNLIELEKEPVSVYQLLGLSLNVDTATVKRMINQLVQTTGNTLHAGSDPHNWGKTKSVGHEYTRGM